MSEEKLKTKVRKEQIAQAALSLIAAHGLKNLNIGSVARRVGIVPSAIYRHFNNKDDLVNSVFAHIQTQLLNNIKEVCQETPSPVNRLRLLLFRHIRLIRENLGIPRIVFSEDVYFGPSGRRRLVFEVVRNYLSGVEDIIRDGQKQGEISSDIDAETLSVMFLGLVQPAALLWQMSNASFDVTKFAEKAWNIFSQSIRNE